MRSRLLLVSRILGYRSFRAVGWPRLLPVNVTVSVTNRCDSRCSTCFLWRFYSDHPELRGRELKRGPSKFAHLLVAASVELRVGRGGVHEESGRMKCFLHS